MPVRDGGIAPPPWCADKKNPGRIYYVDQCGNRVYFTITSSYDNACMMSTAPEMFDFGQRTKKFLERITPMIGAPAWCVETAEKLMELWDQIEKKVNG